MIAGPVSASAPGKIILCGEHAVVYGRPAIAVPVAQVSATVVVDDAPPDQAGPRIVAPDIDRYYALHDAPPADPLGQAAALLCAAAGLTTLPPLTIHVTSTIPIASGLGSGAATAAALIRALARKLDRPDLAADAAVSRLTFEVEKLHHGTPSGIDNTVVAYNRPVYFMRRAAGNLIAPFAVGAPLTLLIGNTGVASPTRIAVGDVRHGWEADPARFEALFDGCGAVTTAARLALEAGDLVRLGALLDENQAYLEAMTVSSAALEQLIGAARRAGALGAKLSGGGRGGNMIALVSTGSAAAVGAALRHAGAVGVLETRVASAETGRK